MSFTGRRRSIVTYGDRRETLPDGALEAEDPISQAQAAKKRRQMDAIRKAAELAAKAAPASVLTWFPENELDSNGLLARVAEDASGVTLDSNNERHPSSPTQQALVKDAGVETLASLLGYSQDESSDDERGAAAPSAKPPESTSDPASTRQGPAEEQTAQAASGEDEIDEQYASFLDELESSGLLKEEPESNGAEPPLDEVPATPQSQAEDRQAVAMATEEEPMANTASAAQTSPSRVHEERAEQAEQRVLGELEGLLHWSEVMDMASGQVYFWNSETDEVVWDPPEGSKPRSKQVTSAIFESGNAETLHDGSKRADTERNPASENAVMKAAAVAESEPSNSANLLQRCCHKAEQLAKLFADTALQNPSPAQAIWLEARIRLKDCKALEKIAAVPMEIQEYFWGRLVKLEAAAEAFLEGPASAELPKASLSSLDAARENGDTGSALDTLEVAAANGLRGQDNSFPDAAREDKEEGELGSGDDMELDSPRGPRPASSASDDEPPPLPEGEPAPPGFEASGSDSPPPLPGDSPSFTREAPPLPSEPPKGEKKREYIGQPVQTAIDLSPIFGANPEPQVSSQVLEEQPVQSLQKRKAEPIAPAAAKRKKASAKVTKSTSKLIDKWAAARKDLESDDEEEEEDAEAMERKRLKAAQEWRLKQSQAGVTALDNPNFQPLKGDWREKVKAARKRAKEDSKRQADAPSKPPDLSVLSANLPSGWKALWDATSRQVYYANPATKESSWTPPQ